MLRYANECSSILLRTNQRVIVLSFNCDETVTVREERVVLNGYHIACVVATTVNKSGGRALLRQTEDVHLTMCNCIYLLDGRHTPASHSVVCTALGLELLPGLLKVKVQHPVGTQGCRHILQINVVPLKHDMLSGYSCCDELLISRRINCFTARASPKTISNSPDKNPN